MLPQQVKDIDEKIVDVITEVPYAFKIDDRQFYLYPQSLGKMYICSRIIESLGLNYNIIKLNPSLEALRIVEQKKSSVISLIVNNTCKTKDELFDSEIVEKRSTFFEAKLDDRELATLLLVILSRTNTDELMKHFGIDEETDRMKRILSVKKNANNISFGGKSIYGTMIDLACERYGWTLNYVVWEISFVNLQMMLADKITSIYLTDDEMKRLGLPKDGITLHADNKEDMQKILAMDWS